MHLSNSRVALTDSSYSGIATHYLHSSSLPDLEARLGELQFKDTDSLEERLKIINSTIEEFTTGLPYDQPISGPVGGNVRQAIDYCFQPSNGIDEVLNALDGQTVSEITGPNGVRDEAATAEVNEWAAKTKQTILQRSPTSVRVALEQLRKGANWSIAETFRREHAIAGKFMEHPDFVEGVSSLLIRKPRTTPQWQPAELSKVSDAEVESYFTAKPDLELLSTEDYVEYPHAWIGLPRERDVEIFVNKTNSARREVIVQHFVKATNGKLGAREKVEEILQRRTEVQEDGTLQWRMGST